MVCDNKPLLEASGITCGYGDKIVLRDVSMHVHPGEVVALIGHNGAGKSTLLKTLFGLICTQSGTIHVSGQTLENITPGRMLELDVGYVPQGNSIFSTLTVRENLEIGAHTFSDPVKRSNAIEQSIVQFPDLRPRLNQRAGSLSGGHQHILALATVLVRSPRVLLLDEPSGGLAPELTAQIFANIRELGTIHGKAVLVVEQKVREVLRVVNRVYVLKGGTVAFHGQATELADDESLRRVYL